MNSINYKGIVNLILIIVAVCSMSFEVYAFEKIDTDRLSKLTVVCEYNGIPLEGVELYLYQVATFDEYGHASLKSEFEVFVEKVNGFGSEWTKEVAGSLADVMKDSSVSFYTSGCSDKEGNIIFENLPCGIYFVVGEGIDLDGLTIHPEVAFESLPGKIFDSSDNESEYTYSYDYSCYLKPMAVEDILATDIPVPTEKVPPYNPGVNNPGSNSEKLPQTGQLWWPVPIFALFGAVVFIIGFVKYKNSEK